MRKHNLIAAAMAIVAASLGTGCGGSSDSTGPIHQNFAERLDSLYFVVAGDSSMDENLRYSRIFAIGLFEAAAMYGVPAKHITVTTSHGIEQWLAFEFVTQEPIDHGIYTNALIATRDNDIHSYLYTQYGLDGSLILAVLTTDDTLRTGSSSHDGTSTVSYARNHECAAPPDLQNPTILGPEPCVTAKFSTSASIEFNDEPGSPRAYRHFSFPATSLDGERLIVP